MQGVDFLKKSCDMNNATACFYLSGLHISGIHAKPEMETVPELSSSPLKSSTVKTPPTPPISTAADFIVQKDMTKAFDFAFKACELKNMYACANLSQMYARGDGTEKSEENAAKYKKIAVEMQDDIKKQQATLGFQQGILS